MGDEHYRIAANDPPQTTQDRSRVVDRAVQRVRRDDRVIGSAFHLAEQGFERSAARDQVSVGGVGQAKLVLPDIHVVAGLDQAPHEERVWGNGQYLPRRLVAAERFNDRFDQRCRPSEIVEEPIRDLHSLQRLIDVDEALVGSGSHTPTSSSSLTGRAISLASEGPPASDSMRPLGRPALAVRQVRPASPLRHTSPAAMTNSSTSSATTSTAMAAATVTAIVPPPSKSRPPIPIAGRTTARIAMATARVTTICRARTMATARAMVTLPATCRIMAATVCCVAITDRLIG